MQPVTIQLASYAVLRFEHQKSSISNFLHAFYLEIRLCQHHFYIFILSNFQLKTAKKHHNANSWTIIAMELLLQILTHITSSEATDTIIVSSRYMHKMQALVM